MLYPVHLYFLGHVWTTHWERRHIEKEILNWKSSSNSIPLQLTGPETAVALQVPFPPNYSDPHRVEFHLHNKRNQTKKYIRTTGP
jgi:hypothetical protein